ncbi:hypothetical protein [Lacrimispora defluvii]|uniref:Phage protein n=1 Tax=Lacrimispora defluvii TaxID=2719233 RepID=A0ABX1VW43_9FIRM|nr:hypothetical protein [Lacrimispora defluvii]NNJ32658.1 hypothetical protein [Lacrimispora defluvii]
MTVIDAIKLFRHEMINEIYHSSGDDALKDSLVEAVNDVADTVTTTYEAEEKLKKKK